MDEGTVTQVARERADKRIDEALGALRKAAREIGLRYDIPEGIVGHSVEELLGRMAYVPSMARDLRRATAQELAKQEITRAFEPAKPETHGSATSPTPPVVDPSKLPPSAPVGLDVAELSGVTVQTVRALKAAGLTNVGQVMTVPDEHLEKISGLGAKSVAQIRTAIARASTPPTPPPEHTP